MYKEVTKENPKTFEIKNPIRAVKTTWPIPVISEIFPTSRIIFGLKLSPTIKRRIAIPNCENIFIVS